MKHEFCTLQCRFCKKYNGYADREYGDGTTICRKCVKSRKIDNFYAFSLQILAQGTTGINDKNRRANQ